MYLKVLGRDERSTVYTFGDILNTIVRKDCLNKAMLQASFVDADYTSVDNPVVNTEGDAYVLIINATTTLGKHLALVCGGPVFLCNEQGRAVERYRAA